MCYTWDMKSTRVPPQESTFGYLSGSYCTVRENTGVRPKLLVSISDTVQFWCQIAVGCDYIARQISMVMHMHMHIIMMLC